jgi:hypothetical protein
LHWLILLVRTSLQQALDVVALPLVGKVAPVNGHGAGLTPPLVSSVEPIGIVPIPSGPAELSDDVVDCPLPALLVPDAWLVWLHGPDEPDIPFVVACDVPAAVPTPPPSNSPITPFVVAPITPEQIVDAAPRVSDGVGLIPGVGISVAPSGIPAGPTEPLATLMPKGVVSPIPGAGLPRPPTCANTGWHPTSVISVAAISSRRTLISTDASIWSANSKPT